MRKNMRLNQIALAAAMMVSFSAYAFEIDTPNPDIKVRLDLTPKYSTAYRLKNPSAALTTVNVTPVGDPGVVNEDDGNRNFNKGSISNRFDLLTELDVTGPGWGLRLSGTAWRDSAYLGRNDNAGTSLVGGPPFPVPTVNNAPTQATNEFNGATRKQHGQGAELLDAFVAFSGEVAGMKSSVKIGKHTLQWGESLFLGQNGIANAQGPVDIARIQSVPNTLIKELLLPVEQISTSVQLAEGLQLGAYYQLKWRKSKLPGVGSYFSNQDYIGGSRVNFGQLPSGAPFDLPTLTSKDNEPGNSGQGGVQLRWSPPGGNFEYGFYAAQYHDKTPSGLVFDFVQGHVRVAYAKKIRTLGASVTSSIGQLNWAVEGSVRNNAPLNSDPAVLGPSGVLACDNNNAGTPCYAVGNTAHLQASGIYVLQPSSLWQGGSLLGEIAYNHRLKVTKNPFTPGFGGLAANTTKGAWAIRVFFEPTYFQVFPGVDLSVPIGVGYNFGGRSSAIGNFAGGASNAGDWSIGVKAKYDNVWNFSLNYTDYFGKAKTFTETQIPGSATPRQLTFGQTLRDRGYLALSVSRTF